MEKLWRSEPVTDAQRGKIKFINAMLGMNVHPQTKGEAYDFIGEYIGEADDRKAEQEKAKAAKQQRIEETQPIIDRLPRKRRTQPKGKMVKMNYQALRDEAKKQGTNVTELSEEIGQGGSYLSNRHTQYDDMVPEDVVDMIVITAGIPRERFVVVETQQIRIDLPETVEEIPVERDTINFSTGKSITANIPETPLPTVDIAGHEGVIVVLADDDMELAQVMAKVKKVTVKQLLEDMIEESLDGMRMCIAEL